VTPAPPAAEPAPPPRAPRWIGPGLIMAASGIGASDIVAATVGGARGGLTLLWALALGAFLKFVLSEGLARWQLATGTTALEGWARHLPRWVLGGFALYVVLWSIAVSGALVSGCGLAVENLTGGAVPRSWGGLAHAVIAFPVIYFGRSTGFSRVMKPLIVFMFFSIVICAALTFHDPLRVLRGLTVPSIPVGGAAYVLSIIGGVGGSLTLLSYGYLLREEKSVAADLRAVRIDLGIAYLFTAIFGLSVMLIANRVFHTAGLAIGDRDAVSRMAAELARLIGPAGFYIYSVGFWAAVTASLIGVWRTVPIICADTFSLLRRLPESEHQAALQTTSLAFRAALAFMALVAVPLAFLGRPLFLIVGFTIVGSLFFPFLAATLLYLNNRVPWPAGIPRPGFVTNALLIVVLLLFLIVGGIEVAALFR